jgi:hypothetical protein
MKVTDIYSCIPIKSTNDLEKIYNIVDIYDDTFPESNDEERFDFFDKMNKGNERISINVVNYRHYPSRDFCSEIMNVKFDNENVMVCITHEGICGGGWYFHYITNKELYSEMIECIGMRSFFLFGDNLKALPEIKFVDLNFFKWSSVKILNNKMEEVIDQEMLNCVAKKEKEKYTKHMEKLNEKQ